MCDVGRLMLDLCWDVRRETSKYENVGMEMEILNIGTLITIPDMIYFFAFGVFKTIQMVTISVFCI